ncbi:MAG TPA: hypothetical protein VF503_10325 [Sphingobium sp.]|uniref:hypothetical protein n=1 Tax=Sphingobium sp. TaxID=1912891 RepID=UPI002ED4FA40
MTEPQHQPGTGPDAYLRDAVAGSMRHAGDVSQLLQGGTQRWTDALLSEVRAHLSGCLNAVEVSIGLHMGDSWLARPVEALGPGYCRLAIERHPAVLSPMLLDHLRLRAAAAMALRMSLAWPSVLEDGEVAPEPSLANGALSEAMTGLRLSVDPWFAAHPLDWPMRADLTAEAFYDLVWAAAALLVEGLTARMGVECGAAMPVLARAAEAIIARHDEQAGPFARAAYVATLARGEGEAALLAEQAALRHDLLLLAALGGTRAAIPLEQAMALLVDGEPEERAALARLLGLSDVAYVALLDALAPIQEAADDSVLPDIAGRYRMLMPDEAVQQLARWRGPAPLVAKLSRMGWKRP